ncbi:MAG: DNA polymerase III subunit gamma/tau [Bacteroidota bacterium]|nr:DNA polymerase III subunit gamma/tau [Bacteroidota bacterium]
MSFLVTARKYRPSTFQEVVAQGHVVNTLLNSIRLGRIAHAYLFSGPRGVGKTTTARIFAKALNCPNAVDGEPCNTCDTCMEISQGRCIDIIEIDGASNNGVEQVRTIRDSVRYMPSRERYKMYIIDEVHMLSKGAFNALLKTLEEPPAHAIFIFATTEPHRLPPTVISRCQRYDFRRIAIEDLVGQLRHICAREGIEAEDRALFTIARKGDGSMRDAESIFDQVVAFSGNDLTYDAVRQVLHVVDQETFFQLTDLIITRNSSGGFTLAEDVVMSGYDIQDFLAGLEEHYRNLLVARATGDTRLIEAPEDIRARYADIAARFSEGDLLRLLKITAQAMQAVRFSPQPRLKFEVALIDMIKMDSTVEISTLLSSLGPNSGIAPTTVASGSTGTSPSQAAPAGSGQPASARTAEPRRDTAPVSEPPRRAAVEHAPRHDRPAAESSALRPRATVTDMTEPLRDAEERFRQALHSASLSSTAAYVPPASARPVPDAATAAPTPHLPVETPVATTPSLPPPPIVQLLIDKLGAVILPGD